MQTKTYKFKMESGLEVTFRDIHSDEVPILKTWMDSSDTAQTIASTFAASIPMEEDWLKKIYEDPERIHFGIEVDGKLIGSWGTRIKEHIGSTGSLIGEKEWRGKGIAKLAHAFRAWLVFTQTDHMVNKLCSEVLWDEKSGLTNIPSRKSLESVGYVSVGKSRGGVFRNGVFLDILRLECYNPFFHKEGDDESVEYKQALAKTQATLKWVGENVIRI